MKSITELQTTLKKHSQAILKYATEGGSPDKLSEVSEVLAGLPFFLPRLKHLTDNGEWKTYPKLVRKTITSTIEDVLTSLREWPEKQGKEQAELIVERIDKLHSVCWQYGLVRPELDPETADVVTASLREQLAICTTEIVGLENKVKSSSKEIDEKAKTRLQEVTTTADEKLNELKTKSAQGIKTIQSEVTGFQEEQKKKTDEMQKVYADASDSLAVKAKEKESALAAHWNSSETLVNQVKEQKKAVDGFVAETQTQLEAAREATVEATQSQEAATKAASETQAKLNEAAKALEDITKHLTSGRDNEADLKTKLDAATQSYANIKEHEEEITAFYGEIEKRKAQLVEDKKEIDAKFNELQSKADEFVSDHTIKVEDIYNKNVEQQEKVTKTLAGATAGGLFREFNVRREQLATARKWWLRGLVGSVGLMIAALMLVYWLSVGEGLGFALILRLAIASPCGYLLYFCAAQYAKERRLEAEYAFKATISLSLEPYRSLLGDMTKAGNVETEFVKELMTKAFVNPVRDVFGLQGGEYERKQRAAEE